MERYISADDLKDRILLAAMDKNTMSIKEIYNMVNNMPSIIFIKK